MNLAIKIKKLCLDRGISVKELERAANLSNGTVSKWVKVSPRTDNLKAVADYFGLTMDQLLKEDE